MGGTHLPPLPWAACLLSLAPQVGLPLTPPSFLWPEQRIKLLWASFPKQDTSVSIVQPLCSEVTWTTGGFQLPQGSIRMNMFKTLVLQPLSSPLPSRVFYLLFPCMTYSASFVTETKVLFFFFGTYWNHSKYHENRWHRNSIYQLNFLPPDLHLENLAYLFYGF